MLTLWAVLGAFAFYLTEGPRERVQVNGLKHETSILAVDMATELRYLRDSNGAWIDTIQKYLLKHEQKVLVAVNSGYGEGGNHGQLWTFPGCMLFSIAILTTLGNLKFNLIFSYSYNIMIVSLKV